MPTKNEKHRRELLVAEAVGLEAKQTGRAL